MYLYLISFDLHDPSMYRPLWERLRAMAASRLLESLWLVSSSTPADQIRDQLAAVAHPDDCFAVIEIQPGSNWATMRAKTDGISWLSANLAMAA
jgi:hypothetical protein